MSGRLLSSFAFLSILTAATSASAVQSAELYRTTGEGFGKYEAKIRFAAGDGIISSFFLWKDGSEMSTVYWNELDFEKLGASCELQTNSIYGLPQSNHEKHHADLTGLCDGYHTYTYEWTPDYIAWFVDGTEIRRDVGTDASAYAENASDGLQMRFNIWPGDATFGGNFSENTLPVYEYVDWAEYSSFTPGAGDEGSDFTLSWRDEFDSLSAGWATGSWDSPLGKSTHSAENVVFADGMAVLALTADDATGVGSGGSATSTGGGGPLVSTGGGSTQPSVGGSNGCTYVKGSHDPSRGRYLVFALAVAVGLLRRPWRSFTQRAME